MSKNRRRRGSDTSAFEAPPTLQEVDKAVYGDTDPFGEIGKVDERRKNARPVDIFTIHADPAQPRRAVPSVVRKHQAGTLEALFRAWVDEIHQSGKPDFDIAAILEQRHLPQDIDGNDDETHQGLLPQHQLPAVEQSLLELLTLASSIRQVGLTNPITITRDGHGYQLETGERRWLAFHLLNIYYPDEGWNLIPALHVPEANVWRQASENNARANLNAIGKARQLAILLFDILVQEKDLQFLSLSEVLNQGGSERDFYAQVADGQQYRIPRGYGERLLQAMGFNHPVQIRQYRALLRLPDDLWVEADDRNLTEGEIRKALSAQSVTRVTVSSDSDHWLLGEKHKKQHGKIWTYANQFQTMSATQRQKALAEINDYQQWVSKLKDTLESLD